MKCMECEQGQEEGRTKSHAFVPQCKKNRNLVRCLISPWQQCHVATHVYVIHSIVSNGLPLYCLAISPIAQLPALNCNLTQVTGDRFLWRFLCTCPSLPGLYPQWGLVFPTPRYTYCINKVILMQQNTCETRSPCLLWRAVKFKYKLYSAIAGIGITLPVLNIAGYWITADTCLYVDRGCLRALSILQEGSTLESVSWRNE